MIATGTNIIHPSFSTASLYVGDLNEDVTEAVLYEIFNTVGHVSSIRVCRDSVTRKSLGYAYVNYHNLTDAERALDTLNYTNIKGQPARIMWSHRDPSLRKSGAGNVFVKNLDKSIDNKALYDTFSMFGNILSCKVATDEFGKSKSYGFIHYEDEESAKEAIEKVNGIKLGSKAVYVGHFIKKSDRITTDSKYTNLYVKNFPDKLTENDLKQLFSPYGEITSMIIRTDNKNRKFCFVNYADPESAKNAVEGLNGKKILEDGQLDTNYNPNDLKGDQKSGDNEKKEDNQEEEKKDIEKQEADKNNQNTGTSNNNQAVNNKTITNNTNNTGNNVSSENILYVSPHQSRARRHALLKAKFDSLNNEVKNKYNGANLYIKNIDDSITDSKLKELFEPFGTITSAKIMKDEKDHSKGFGFVCFQTQEEATKAVTEMHLKLVNGKPLYVGLAEKREQRLSRLQQRFRMHPIRHHHHINNPMQYTPNPQSPQLQFNQNTMGYATRPVMTPFQQNSLMSWRQQVHHQQAVSQQQAASQQQMGFNNNLRGQMNPMRLYSQNNMMHQGTMKNQNYNNSQQNVTLQTQPTQNMHSQQASGMIGRRNTNRNVQNISMNKNQVQMGLNKNTSQLNHAQNPTMNANQTNNFKFTSQARNRMEVPNKGGKINNVNNMNHLNNMNNVNTVNNMTGAMNSTTLTASALASAPLSMQKQVLGENLFPLVSNYHPTLAGKITGMMLEMDNSELLILLENEEQLKKKIDEALIVLQQAK